MKCGLRRLMSMAMAGVLMMALVAAAVAPAIVVQAAYTDIGYHWAAAEINRWEALGALSDFGSGAFNPNAPIKRAEFFSIIVRSFGAEEEADISRFTDVPSDAWYRPIVARANKMRIAEGTSETTMHPESNITRQDAATLVSRAFGLMDSDLGYLGRYADRESISVYAQNHVAAMTQYGYMIGSGVNFKPRDNLSRAEAVKIVDNLFAHYYKSETGFDNLTLDGNVMSVRPDSVFNGLTVNGDLILCDGVGAGSAALNGCVINGRLLVRGGGENSVVLSDTTVRDGITVLNPNLNTRIVTTGATSAERLTAYSGFALVGTGVHNIKLADDSIPNSHVTLSGVVLDALDAGGFAARISMPEGKISKLNFIGDSAGTQFSIGGDASVSYLSTVVPNVTVLGDGRVADAFINAPGAVLTGMPGTYTVGANLTASIAGEIVSGKYLNTGNWVTRDGTTRPVRQDNVGTGGYDVIITTELGRSANTVTVTQKPLGKIPLSGNGGRLGYQIGFFVPAPAGMSGRGGTVSMLTYQNTDGGIVVMRNVPLTYQGGEYGLWLRVPVTAESSLNRGRLTETMYISWDGSVSENLQFRSGWLDLEPLIWYEENVLVDMYRYARLEGYSGAVYYGAEAIRRLLCGDNALGLDTKGFAAFSEQDQEDLAASLYDVVDLFVSKKAIQDRLDQVISGKGALYAVNRALTTDQMRRALELPVFARELGIEISAGSMYGVLSETGKNRVSYTMLINRKKDYANEKAVKTAFDKAVSDIKAAETGLLVAINNAPADVDVQKIIETKANADLLGFSPTSEPYKSYTAKLKLGLAQLIFNGRPYTNVDDIAQIIRDYLATPWTSNPEDDTVISSMKITPVSITLVTGGSAHIGNGSGFDVQLVITTPSGEIRNPLPYVTSVVDKEDIVTYNASTGVVTAGKTLGTAKITMTSVMDTKKKVTLTIKVVAPIPATGVKLAKSFVEVEEGGRLELGPLVTIIPANSTDKLRWSSDDPATASVSADTGEVTGVKPGFTYVSVATESGQKASCLVAVVSREPGVMVYPAEATVGTEEAIQLYAVVSPLNSANRTVKWTSADTEIATVDGSGKVTGKYRPDTADPDAPPVETVLITATASSNPELTADAEITVDSAKRALVLNTNRMTIYPNGMEYISATVLPLGLPPEEIVSWSVVPYNVDDPIITFATFADDGEESRSTYAEGPSVAVVGLQPGKATVVAALTGSKTDISAICEVEVLEGKPTITVTPKTVELLLGDKTRETKLLSVTFSPNSIVNRSIKWSSENDLIAVVDSGGRITAKGIGQTEITGIPEADRDARLVVSVTVKDIAVTQFNVSPNNITITQGNTQMLSKLFNITMKPDNASNKFIEWSSSDENTAAILYPGDADYDNELTNADSDTSDAYGGALLVARKATVEYHDERINDANGDPILDSSGNWQFKRVRDDSHKITLVAQASNGVKIELLLSIEPEGEDDSQVRNMKIDMTRWIYPVGFTQPMTIRYNIEGRDPISGAWKTGVQPPNPKITWQSSRPDIAYVNARDELITLKPGLAMITATSQLGGVPDSVTVIVSQNGPESVRLAGLDSVVGYGRYVKIPVGDMRTVTPQIEPPVYNDAQLVWSAEKWNGDQTAGMPVGPVGDIISMNPTNTITQDGAGMVFTGGEIGWARVTVQPHFQSPEENGRLASVSITELYNLCVAAGVSYDAYLAMNGIVRVGSTSNSEYYTIDESKLDMTDVNGTAIPQVKLSKTSSLSLIVPCFFQDGLNVFLVQVVAPVTLSAPAPQASAQSAAAPEVAAPGVHSADLILAARSAGISAASAVYESSNPAVAEVDDMGLVTAVAAGEAMLTAEAGGQKVSVKMTVAGAGAPAASEKSMRLRSTASVRAGSSLTLLPVASSGKYDMSGITWQSSKPDIAEVDASGRVTGQKAGKAVITATVAGTSLKATCAVTVSEAAPAKPVTGLSLSGASLTLEEGKASTLKTVFQPASPTLKGVTWLSSDSTVASVSESGKVTAVGAGSASVVALSDDGGFAAVCSVTVTAKPIKVLSVSLNKTAATMSVGGEETLTAAINPSNAPNQAVTWRSSNSSVVKVENGRLKALKKGTVVITVTTAEGSKKATCRVTVK